MDFFDVIEKHRPKNDDVLEQSNPDETPEASDKLLDTIPEGMPLTNRLDRMTQEQGAWAIRNGTAWIAYLKEQKAEGHDVKLVESDAKPVNVSDADKYQAVCDILESVWLELTDNMQRVYLQTEQIPDWVDVLQWAVKAIPVGLEAHRDKIQDDLKTYQEKLTKPKTRRKPK